MVDPITLLSILAGIVGITLLLRQAVIKYIAGRKKRSLIDCDNWAIVITQGTLLDSWAQCYQCMPAVAHLTIELEDKYYP